MATFYVSYRVNSSNSADTQYEKVNAATQTDAKKIIEARYRGSRVVFPNSPEFGTFTDPRDGNVYKTVKIGNQVWMAENLRYEGGFAADGRGSIAYSVDSDLAKIYGRLYTWSGAMNINSKYNKESVPSVLMKKTRKGDYCQGIAPEGWHIPSKKELETLLRYVKRLTGVCDEGGLSEALRASGEWEGSESNNVSGFSALPAGNYGSYYEVFGSLGDDASFWSSTEGYEGLAYRLRVGDGYAYVGSINKYEVYSVRCLKDN